MLNGQGWPRPSPWSYPGVNAFGGIAGPHTPCVPSAAAVSASTTSHGGPPSTASSHGDTIGLMGVTSLNDSKKGKRATSLHQSIH